MEPQKQQSYIKIKKSGFLKHPNVDVYIFLLVRTQIFFVKQNYKAKVSQILYFKFVWMYI